MARGDGLDPGGSGPLVRAPDNERRPHLASLGERRAAGAEPARQAGQGEGGVKIPSSTICIRVPIQRMTLTAIELPSAL